MPVAIKLQLWVTSLSVFVSLGLLSSGEAVFARSTPPSPSPIEQNPAAVESPTATINFSPLTPVCPLPPIPVSETTAEEVTGVSVGHGNRGVSPSHSHTPGDGSDGDLIRRIREFLEQGQFEAALELVPQIDDEFERANSLLTISSAYIQLGQVDQAEAIALTIPEVSATEEESSDGFPSPREQAISQIATYYIQTNQLEAALSILENLEESSRVSFMFDIAQRYREQGQVDTAVSLLDRTLASYRNELETPEDAVAPPELAQFLQVWILARFVSAYVAAEQLEKAADLASELFETAQTFPSQDLRTLNLLASVAGVYRLAGQGEKAPTVLNYVEQSTETLAAPYLKTIVLTGIVGEYEALGDRDRALEVLSLAQEFANEATDQSQRNISTVAIVQAYGVLGQYDQAFQVAEAIEPPDLREQIQQSITCAQSNP